MSRNSIRGRDDETDEGRMAPRDVRESHQDVVEYLHEEESDETPFEALFAPRGRIKIFDGLLQAHPEPWTASEISEWAGMDVSTFTAHRDFLLMTDVIEEAGEKAGAQTFRLNPQHPVAQLVSMIDTVFGHGKTPILLEEQFIGEPGADYEPGDHPKDPR